MRRNFFGSFPPLRSSQTSAVIIFASLFSSAKFSHSISLNSFQSSGFCKWNKSRVPKRSKQQYHVYTLAFIPYSTPTQSESLVSTLQNSPIHTQLLSYLAHLSQLTQHQCNQEASMNFLNWCLTALNSHEFLMSCNFHSNPRMLVLSRGAKIPQKFHIIFFLQSFVRTFY